MADLNKFSKRMKQIARRIEVNVDKGVVKLGSLIQQTVITATPVDTGRARGNWFASLGSPRLAADENSKDLTGAGRISSNDAIINSRGADQSIYITNNLPYIKRLNEGSSQQAPAGFVEKAVSTARRALRNEIRLLRK